MPDHLPLDRRQFLRRAAMGSAAFSLALAGGTGSRAWAAPKLPVYPFRLGVASGDPMPDGVVLWTRLAPSPMAHDGGMPDASLPVRWEVALDEHFRRIVRRGTEAATPELAHSVHAEVAGLQPGREYFYRFRAGDDISPVGRTKTAPEGAVDRVRFALASCQSWTGGRYGAYASMTAEDLDLVVHVGDYAYGSAGTETLTDFRLIHARYKTSPDLQAAHAAFPFVVVFDDHEVTNNWASERSQPDGELSHAYFTAIRAAAFQAYYEHLPLRRVSLPRGIHMQLFRRLRYGDLAQFNVLDTRQYRDAQLNAQFPAGTRGLGTDDPRRTLTGEAQERWLLDGLSASTARWNVIAQQVIMAQFDYDAGPGVSVNHDQWDGYAASRSRILDFIAQRRPSNPVVVTGDWHSSWVNDLKLDFDNPLSPTVATEFVGTSISSGCGWAGQVEAALPANPHVKFFDGTRRGYLRCDLTPQQWKSDYRVVTAATDVTSPATTLTSWVVEDGRPGAVPS